MRKYLFILMVMLIAATSMIYQLSVITALIFILGDSLTLFSIFTGIFLCAMGFGVFLVSRQYSKFKLLWRLQIVMALAGLLVLPVIFLCYGFLTQLRQSVILTSAALPSESSLLNLVLWLIGIAAEIGFGMLAGMHLPLLQDIIGGIGEFEKAAVAKVLSYDYIGSFFGAVLFPIFLFPQIGLLRSVFLASFINILIAVYCIFSFGERNFRAIALLFLILILQVIVFVQSPNLENFIDGLVYGQN